MNLLDNFLGRDIRFLAKALEKIIKLPAATGGTADIVSANLNSVNSVLKAADAALSTRIDGVAGDSSAINTVSVALAVEVSNRTSAEGALSVRIDTASNAVSLEIGNRTSADNVLSVRIDTTSNAISVETSARNALSVIVSNLNSAHNTLSGNHVSLVSDIGRISLNLSAVSTRMDAISVLASNAQSIANVVSAAHVSLVSDVGRISTNHVSLVSDVGRISSNVQTLSVGLGGVQLARVATGNQTLSSTGKISGLSLSVAAAGVYQIEGYLMHAMSATGTYGFAISTSAATFTNAAYRWLGNISVVSTGTGTQGLQSTWAAAGYGNESGIGSFTFSTTAGTAATNMQTELKGIFVISSAGGTLQLKAKGASGADLIIKAGSYLKAFKLA